MQRDPNWENVKAWSSMQNDIDHNLHYWEVYVSVTVGSMFYWSQQWIPRDDIDDFLGSPEMFALLLKEMIQMIDDRIKEDDNGR